MTPLGFKYSRNQSERNEIMKTNKKHLLAVLVLAVLTCVMLVCLPSAAESTLAEGELAIEYSNVAYNE